MRAIFVPPEGSPERIEVPDDHVERCDALADLTGVDHVRVRFATLKHGEINLFFGDDTERNPLVEQLVKGANNWDHPLTGPVIVTGRGPSDDADIPDRITGRIEAMGPASVPVLDGKVTAYLDDHVRYRLEVANLFIDQVYGDFRNVRGKRPNHRRSTEPRTGLAFFLDQLSQAGQMHDQGRDEREFALVEAQFGAEVCEWAATGWNEIGLQAQSLVTQAGLEL